MAGGKLSARQKMINLMYLVFIAMLALQMSKKVLTAFGKSSEEVQEAAKMKAKSNAYLLKTLAQKAKEQPAKYGEKYKLANELENKTKAFQTYISNLKTEILKKEFNGKIPDSLDYESMDKSSTVDNMFFLNGKETKKAKEFQKTIEDYRNYLTSLNVDGKPLDNQLKSNIENRFDTKDEVHGKKGKRKEPWLMANFEGFPSVSTIFKLDNYINKAKETENEVLSNMLRGQMASDVSVTNYEPVVVLDKPAFFPGEKVTGKVALGRVDSTMSFKEVLINGKPVPKDLLTEGYVHLNLPAGNVGEKEVKGVIVFNENNKDVKLPFVVPYAVIPIPNSAVISADKMNVVYRGVKNPLSISIPGVPDHKVTVSAPGITKVGNGKYVMDVTRYKGKTVDIKVSGKVNGKTVTDSKTFRVKNIPPPVGTVRGESGVIKMPKRNLELSTIGAELPDFDFDVKLGVKSFDFKVPGQPTQRVNGTKLDAKAKQLLRRVKRGQNIQIYNIKAYLKGNSGYQIKKVSPVIIEIIN
ncbi:MAG TPA: gliding motility protein GldM [Flavobacteriales bacterium]|nr:gliding motility protein GldM [Flavobacteriales bacterium]